MLRISQAILLLGACMACVSMSVAVVLSKSTTTTTGVRDTLDGTADKITDLPGLPSPAPFDQYAGYITVDESHGRRLFYWLQESQNSDNDPLVLWLNGGPGCSSVGGGLMTENGAFFPNSNGTLSYNPWSWNNVANMVFLESPAGVGFSFSDDPADYTVGDNRTAYDTFAFLVGFVKRYPRYANRPFWVTGESYGGHYVPDISNLLVEMAAKGNKPLDFQGFMVGNAWTVAEVDNTGAVTDWYTHNIITKPMLEAVLSNCNMSNIGPLAMTARAAAEGVESALLELSQASTVDSNAACVQAQMNAQMNLANVNIYDIYADVCTKDTGKTPKLPVYSGDDDDPASDTGNGGRIDYDPCISNDATVYLNRHDVQVAIHANTTLGRPWSDCSSVVNYSRADLLSSMLPIYRNLMASGIHILVYSGDVDGIVPTTGTRVWLQQLDLTVKDGWRQWLGPGGQVGGYVTTYDKLTFTTVRNAGHMVPYTQPGRALYMFEHFLKQQPF